MEQKETQQSDMNNVYTSGRAAQPVQQSKAPIWTPAMVKAGNCQSSFSLPRLAVRPLTGEPDAGEPPVRVCGDYVHETHLSMLLKSKS